MTAEILAQAAWFEDVEAYLDDHVAPRFGCPNPDCGETGIDNLVWHNACPSEAGFDASRPEYVKCQTCDPQCINLSA